MAGFVCPLCSTRFSEEEYARNLRFKTNTCRWESDTDAPFVSYYCSHYNRHFAISQKIFRHEYDQETIERFLDLTVEHLIRRDCCTVDGEKRNWHFYLDTQDATPENHSPEYVNMAGKLREYPTQAIDAAHRTMLNLSVRHPYYGHRFGLEFLDHRLGFDRNGSNVQDVGILMLLVDLQYLKVTDTINAGPVYTITAAGWQKIEQLRRQEQTVRQGFVAMAFRDEAKPIRESFRKAITAMGYQAVILDEKEHNNQIVPEIFYEIRRSKFVVVDVTYPNYGAYYEAGYAQALGKQVIICCREDVYRDTTRQPHFDIAQQSIIVWKDHEELVRRLSRRIEVTVQ